MATLPERCGHGHQSTSCPVCTLPFAPVLPPGQRAAPSLVDDETCVTCHHEGPLLLEIHDDSFESGRIIVPTCATCLRESFEYLLTVEAPRRGWTDGYPMASPIHRSRRCSW